jgi:hypothetical protein
MTGEAIVGEMSGKRLAPLPGPIVMFITFRESFPLGEVLSRDTGFVRDYGRNPYAFYASDPKEAPFLFRGKTDPRLPPMERVASVELDGCARAYPFSRLRAAGLVNDKLCGHPILVVWEPKRHSVLDEPDLGMARAGGSAAIFDRAVHGSVLWFEQVDGVTVDTKTKSRWNPLGVAVQGPLKGSSLRPVPHGNPFAFSWLAFRPGTEVWGRGKSR